MGTRLIRNVDNFNSWLNVKPFYINIANEGMVLSERKMKVYIHQYIA